MFPYANFDNIALIKQVNRTKGEETEPEGDKGEDCDVFAKGKAAVRLNGLKLATMGEFNRIGICAL